MRIHIRIRINFAEVQPKGMEYEPSLALFRRFESFFEARIWIRVRIRVKSRIQIRIRIRIRVISLIRIRINVMRIHNIANLASFRVRGNAISSSGMYT
jgi:hypothetical protein